MILIYCYCPVCWRNHCHLYWCYFYLMTLKAGYFPPFPGPDHTPARATTNASQKRFALTAQLGKIILSSYYSKEMLGMC